MYSFKNDYSDGGHPEILKQLTESAMEQTDGYGEDRYCLEAIELIRDKLEHPDVDIHFMVGGTMTNRIAISSFLRPHEAVISVNEGHIFVHETGAIEATGHKIITVEGIEGKITPGEIEAVVTEHHFEHMVKPKLVYISQSTEMGTIYSLSELRELRVCCDRLNLLLYMDGARLGSALCSKKCDLDLKKTAALCDAFYIGGTKNGALFGEALIICNELLKSDFRYMMKQKGGLLAKGRMLGLQFKTLFTNNLYFDLATHANKMAEKLQKRIIDAGFKMKFHSSTNQIFPVFPEEIVEKLEKEFLFYRWESNQDGITVRLICSWDTDEKKIERFIETLK